MKRLILCLVVLTTLFSGMNETHADLLELIPPPPFDTLFPPSGPFGFGGRGVIFRAETDFTMSAFEMEATWPGVLDFVVEVYEVVNTSRGNLLSSTQHPALSAGPGPFLSLDHTHSFQAGNIYEIMMGYFDPGLFSRTMNLITPV